jgi:hypothetical protein
MNLKTPLAAALLVCAFSLQAQAETLSAQDIRKLAPGRYAVSVMGLVNMTVSMRPNGTVAGTTSKGKRDTGSWSIQGQRLCVAWNKWLGGQRRCATLKGANGSYSGGGLSLRRI